jgi:hypothetical protein
MTTITKTSDVSISIDKYLQSRGVVKVHGLFDIFTQIAMSNAYDQVGVVKMLCFYCFYCSFQGFRIIL